MQIRRTLERLKGALSGLRKFLITESPLTMMKNVFGFTLKAFFVLKIIRIRNQNNIRNIFPEKSYTKCGGETVPRSFFKK